MSSLRVIRWSLTFWLALTSSYLAESENTLGLFASQPAFSRFVPTEQGYTVPYADVIPGTNIRLDVAPIPDGDFLLGRPNNEASRSRDEGPQVCCTAPPFWMGKVEVT